MDLNLELKAFMEAMKKNGCPIWMFERDEDGNFEDMTMAHSWYAWQEKAKAQAVPEGCVLIEANEYEDLKSECNYAQKSAINWSKRAYEQRAKVELIKNEVERFKQSGSPLDSKHFVDQLIEMATFKHDQELKDFVLMPRDLTDEIAEAIAKEANCCGGIAHAIYVAAIKTSESGAEG